MNHQQPQQNKEVSEEQEILGLFSDFKNETHPSKDSFRSLLQSLQPPKKRSSFLFLSPYVRYMTSVLAVLVFVIGGFFSWKQLALGPTIEPAEPSLSKEVPSPENTSLASNTPRDEKETLSLVLASLNEELVYTEYTEDTYIDDTHTSFTNVLDETTYDF